MDIVATVLLNISNNIDDTHYSPLLTTKDNQLFLHDVYSLFSLVGNHLFIFSDVIQ